MSASGRARRLTSRCVVCAAVPLLLAASGLAGPVAQAAPTFRNLTISTTASSASTVVRLTGQPAIDWPHLSWTGHGTYLAVAFVSTKTGAVVSGAWDLREAQATAFPPSPIAVGTGTARPHVVEPLTVADTAAIGVAKPTFVRVPAGTYRIDIVSDAPARVMLPLAGYTQRKQLTATGKVSATVVTQDNTPLLGVPGVLSTSVSLNPSTAQTMRVTATVVVVDGSQHALQGAATCADGGLPPLCAPSSWESYNGYDIGRTVTNEDIATYWTGVFFVINGWSPSLLPAGSHTVTTFFPTSRHVVRAVSYSLVLQP